MKRSAIVVLCVAVVVFAMLLPAASTFIAVTLLSSAIVFAVAAHIRVNDAPPVQSRALISVALFRGPPPHLA